MSDLCERLQNLDEAGVYSLSCPQAILEANVALSGLVLFEVNLGTSHGKGELLANMAQVLQAPEWFGHNWDALADVLGDLSWQAGDGYVLLLCGGGEKLGLTEVDYDLLMGVFNDSVSYWKSQGKPFWVFFSDDV